MGPLPRTHGMLGAMLESPEPHRTDDIRADPRFRGWWPRAHPQMRSFLGVPIVARGRGDRRALPDREGGRRRVLRRRRAADRAARRARRDRDRERAAVRALARAVDRRGAQPARARAARLVTQRLFGVALAAESAVDAARARPRPPRRTSCARVRELARGAMEELRAVVFELRPGLARGRGARRPCCASTSTCCGACPGRPIELRVGDAAAAAGRRAPRRCSGSPRRRCGTRCATPSAERIEVRLGQRARRARAVVADDGRGFDPPARGARAAARADLDGGARDGAGRDARGRLGARRGHDASGWRCRRDPRRCSPTTTRSCARACGRSSTSRTTSRWSAEAGDGEAAVDAAARTDPDVVLLDLVMPRLDGVGALRAAARVARRARDRAHELRRRRQAVRRAARRRRRLPAQGRRAGRAGARDPLRPRRHSRRCRPRSPPAWSRRSPTAAAHRARRRAHPARARGADPDRPRALEQGDRAASSAWPRRRSRPTSPTSSASSG